jgi:hypothetical protein
MDDTLIGIQDLQVHESASVTCECVGGQERRKPSLGLFYHHHPSHTHTQLWVGVVWCGGVKCQSCLGRVCVCVYAFR